MKGRRRFRAASAAAFGVTRGAEFSSLSTLRRAIAQANASNSSKTRRRWQGSVRPLSSAAREDVASFVPAAAGAWSCRRHSRSSGRSWARRNAAGSGSAQPSRAGRQSAISLRNRRPPEPCRSADRPGRSSRRPRLLPRSRDCSIAARPPWLRAPGRRNKSPSRSSNRREIHGWLNHTTAIAPARSVKTPSTMEILRRGIRRTRTLWTLPRIRIQSPAAAVPSRRVRPDRSSYRRGRCKRRSRTQRNPSAAIAHGGLWADPGESGQRDRQAQRVAAGSPGASFLQSASISKRHWMVPKTTVSPEATGTGRPAASRTPLTKVPFIVPTSSTTLKVPSVSRLTRAWRREIDRLPSTGVRSTSGLIPVTGSMRPTVVSLRCRQREGDPGRDLDQPGGGIGFGSRAVLDAALLDVHLVADGLLEKVGRVLEAQHQLAHHPDRDLGIVLEDEGEGRLVDHHRCDVLDRMRRGRARRVLLEHAHLAEEIALAEGREHASPRRRWSCGSRPCRFRSRTSRGRGHLR